MNFDVLVYIIIALILNIFAHQVACSAYKNCPYDEKYEKSMILLFVLGISAIVSSNFLIKRDQKYSESVVSIGMTLGGLLLILTVIVVNWGDMTDEIRLFISGLFLIFVLYYFYNYYEKHKMKIYGEKDEDIRRPPINH